MDKFLIKGNQRPNGEVMISGAKNAALPLIAALIVARGQSVLHHVPRLHDVAVLIKLLNGMGASAKWDGDNTLLVNCDDITHCYAPYDLVSTMRASILVLGGLLARFGHAEVSLPGGCAIGSRPVDQHLKALTSMGASIEVQNGYVKATAAEGLHGADFTFDMVTVGGTQNTLIAASLAKGTTRLYNCASEPEVVDLCHLLVAMGAKIDGIGTPVLIIQGQKTLTACQYRVTADRIEAGSYLAGALMNGGDVRAVGISPMLLAPILPKFEAMGADVLLEDDSVRVKINTRPRAVDIRTQPHPGFPTDMQAQMMAICALADGNSTIIENIFENRFMHAAELTRLGAKIRLDGHSAYIEGVARLSGAPVKATDLRAAMALVMACAVADGDSVIEEIYHIDRGYEKVEQKLTGLGIEIIRA